MVKRCSPGEPSYSAAAMRNRPNALVRICRKGRMLRDVMTHERFVAHPILCIMSKRVRITSPKIVPAKTVLTRCSSPMASLA